ncbi:MAG: hypothetical protein KHZ24_09270 [Coriobacteriia bacterium]|nr:hypothetical protein [Coriobacteriia bacterium]
MSNATKDPKDTKLENAGCCCECGSNAAELTDEQMAEADGGAMIYDDGPTFISEDAPASFLSVDRNADSAEKFI